MLIPLVLMWCLQPGTFQAQTSLQLLDLPSPHLRTSNIRAAQAGIRSSVLLRLLVLTSRSVLWSVPELLRPPLCYLRPPLCLCSLASELPLPKENVNSARDQLDAFTLTPGFGV